MPDVACAVNARDDLGESCLWCPRTRRIWWLDILKPALQSYDPATREHRIYPLPGKTCGNVALRAAGGFVLALDGGLHGYDPETGRLEFLVQAEPGRPGNRYNDGRCDRRGRLWIGTMDRDVRSPSGSLYRIGADRTALRLLDGITVSNSIAFSPDDRTMYFADTPRHIIWSFDYDIDTGTATGRRAFADLTARGGLPDGSSVDANGFLWNAEFAGGRLTRYAPDGRVDRTIELPVSCPTCCCFGGERLDTLYVTGSTHRLTAEQKAGEPYAGGLLSLDPGVRGLPEAAFGG